MEPVGAWGAGNEWEGGPEAAAGVNRNGGL